MKATIAATLLLAGLAGINMASRRPQPADGELEQGRELFVRHCASCHGLEARGDGPAAVALKARPPDLTRIRKPGEPFPRSRIRDVIDGEKTVNAHGNRSMPVWGRILREQGGYARAQDEILLIVQYLESIQAE